MSKIVINILIYRRHKPIDLVCTVDIDSFYVKYFRLNTNEIKL
jgi:hypothetical protein